MKAVFRTDASLLIGTGHVIRCLTLADILKSRGVQCHFISRTHEGNLIKFIENKGFIVHQLPIDTTKIKKLIRQPNQCTLIESNESAFQSEWLGSTQKQDADECISILKSLQPDWLIVDHYALDAVWESLLSRYCKKTMVIDDLANRYHFCDLLLDQTLGRKKTDYQPLVPKNCYLLCGPEYSLLRPEFSALRSYSLTRRKTPFLQHILISMGGGDTNNLTGKILKALQHSSLDPSCKITVVMGPNSTFLDEIQEASNKMLWSTQVFQNVHNMAQLLADSDLSIGAAGTTSWERCCLGVPTLMFIIAENQRKIGIELENFGAAKLLDLSILNCDHTFISEYWESSKIAEMSKISASITDGTGSIKVADIMMNKV